MKPSGIGGQAVIEGVMMRNKDVYAIAVRKPDQEIIVEKFDCVSWSQKYKVCSLPIIRGVVAFVDSMVIGMKTISFSASFFEEEEVNEKELTQKEQKKKEKMDSLVMGLTIAFSIVLAVALFILLPLGITELLRKRVESATVLAILEGVIRIGIFVLYILSISRMKDIQRVFMYHGAEHKTINCIEHGLELTVENVKKQSREHKRCGTSFLLIVVVISSVIFTFIRIDQVVLKMVCRLLLVPIIAGISYEFIRFAGKSESKLIEFLSKPGLWMQGLTTREPSEDMIEVAIKSVEAVFDWKTFIKQYEYEELSHSDRFVQADNEIKKVLKETVASRIERNVEEEIARQQMTTQNAMEENEKFLEALDKYFIPKK